MKCDIIIPIWNQLSYTRRCIENIQRNTKVPYRLILIDNASDDETKDFLAQLADSGGEIELIRNETNMGFIKAVNQGLRLSDSPYVCIMNNDTVPAKDWLARMIGLAESRKDIGIVNPQSNSPGALTIDEYAKLLAGRKGEYIETNQCLGFSMLVKRELIQKIGYLDEVYGLGGFDDTDFSMRAHKAGYRCVSACDAYVYHDWHTSFKKAGNREELVRRNEKIFFARWGKYLRIAFPILNDSEENLMSDIYTSLGLAREWNWVHAWFNSDNNSKRFIERRLPKHQSMRLFYLPRSRWLFFISVLLKLVERSLKKKKHFDIVLVSDPVLFKTLSFCRRLFRTPLFYIGKKEPAIDITDENSWSKRAHFIVDKIKNLKPNTYNLYEEV